MISNIEKHIIDLMERIEGERASNVRAQKRHEYDMEILTMELRNAVQEVNDGSVLDRVRLFYGNATKASVIVDERYKELQEQV